MHIIEIDQSFRTNTPIATPTLRPYQTRFISEVYAHIRAGAKRVLGFSATGSGKTVVAAQIAAHAASRGKRVMFVVHRDILISQSYDKLCSFGLNDCGFIKSGWQENQKSLVQIASVQTLCKRNWWHDYPANLVILDECHIVSFAAIVRQMMSRIYPEAVYLGLTASPWRLSKRESLGDIFEVLVSAPMPRDLIDAGFLVKPAYFSPSLADLEKVGQASDGDFDEGQLAIACDRPELIQQIVQDWFNLAYGRRTIVFTVNVSHARNLANAFTAAGVPSAYVDGTMSALVTNQIYRQLADGELLVLASCLKLTEGFDLPSVSAVILARPTQSRALHFQMIGRGLRLSPETGKTDCVVIDPSGNIQQRHGFVEDIKEISLDQGEESQGSEAPKKICPVEKGGCGAILYTLQMQCPECNYVFEKLKKVYLVPDLEQLLSEEDIERYEFYRNNLCTAYQKKFLPGWAAIIFKEKYGHWPPDSWAKGAVFGNSPSLEQQSDYHDYLQVLAQRKEKSESWMQQCLSLEFGFEFGREFELSYK